MKRTPTTFVWFCLLLLVSCVPASLKRSSAVDQPQLYSFPQDLHCAIVGTITELGSNEPVAGCNIIAPGHPSGTTSDHLGNFALSGLEPETYQIRVISIGHETAESIRFSLKANDLAIVNVRLLRKSASVSHEREKTK